MDESKAHVVHGARAEGARRRAQSTQWFAAVAQFSEQIGYFRRQRHQRAGGGAVGKVGVLPEVAQHFDQMGFAAAKEAADPDGVLLRFSQTAEVGLEHPLHSARVFAIADKVLQLETERLDLPLIVADFGNFRDTVVE